MMPRIQSSSPQVRRDFGHATFTEIDKNCARLVLDVYRAALGHRSVDQNPFDAYQNAFDVAAHTYSERNPGVPDKEARRAVANVICRNL
jgi:hypothetical protein